MENMPMRVKTFNRRLKITSIFLLFFLVWDFLPVYPAISWAALPEQRKTQQERTEKLKPASAAERFKVALDQIKEKAVQGASRIDRGEDDIAEINDISAKKAEIDGIAREIHAEFASTEKMLKDRGLGKEILKRHTDFVAHFERNIKELNENLDDLDKAKTKADRKAKIEKVRLHLEKTQPKKLVQRLDPNNLPFKTRKITKTREPYLKKEDFEKLFPKQKRNRLAAQEFGHEWARIFTNGFEQKANRQKPLLVASNGPLTGLLSSSPQPETLILPYSVPSAPAPEWLNRGANDFDLQSAFATSTLNLESGTLNLAAATTMDPPTNDDLAENGIEIQFSDAIRTKAQELGCSAVRLYEFTRNEIFFTPAYGSIQGADMCLQTKQCNSIDTSSLLISLLRSCSIPARYAYGTVEIPIDKVKNWVGGVTDQKMAGTILTTNGVPVTLVKTSAGVYKNVQMEHVWVETYVPYGNYRGSGRDDSLKLWIPLDASYKQYEYKSGTDLYSALAVNGESYIKDYITDTSSLTIPEEFQASFPAYTISPYQYYSKRLINYIDTNLPSATYEDVFGADTIESSKTIIKKEYPYLLGSLPYNVIAKAGTYSSLPDSLRHKVTFTIESATTDPGLSYTTTLAETAGKRITLSYEPATSADEALASRYGTLLSVPPYLMNVKPVLKINGITAATGSSIGLGQEQTFNMSFNLPNIGTELVSNIVIAGDYSAITTLFYKVPFTLAGDKMETLINNIGSTDLDDLLGQMLYDVGLSYFHHLNFEEELYAKNFQMILIKGLSEAMITSHAETQSLWGMPYKIEEGGIGIDVDKNEYLPFPIDGSTERSRDFMIVSGLGSSAWEDRVLQAFYDVPSVSAARLLRYANQQGVPIYTIDSTNISTTLSQIQVSSEVTDDIKNAVNAGKKVIISKTEVQYEGWTGIGYIVIDPTTGAAAYMISGGAAGGMGTRKPAKSVRDISQFIWGDGSALKTIVMRTMIVMLALYRLETTYLYGGTNPECGVDCL
jgi:hypothetical protein